MAGVELAAGAVRVVAGRRVEGRLRVENVESRTCPSGAIVGGLVVDRATVEKALSGMFAHLERRHGRLTHVVVAQDGDDIRTFHLTTGFERTTPHAAVTANEMARASREAAADFASQAQRALSSDLALRGIATVQARLDAAGYFLDGRPLSSLVGFQGRLIDVRADVTIVPLVVNGAALAVLSARPATLASGAYALASLLARSGIADAAIVRLGADLTSVSLIRSSAVVATRSFSLGRNELESRANPHDDSVWATAVVEAIGDGEMPTHWLVAGVGEAGLLDALGQIALDRGGTAIEAAPLRLNAATRLLVDSPFEVEYLVAAGAAALGAELAA